MKNDLVTNLSFPCGLRAWSKTSPKKAPAAGEGQAEVSSRGGSLGARTLRVCCQHFQAIIAVWDICSKALYWGLG